MAFTSNFRNPFTFPSFGGNKTLWEHNNKTALHVGFVVMFTRFLNDCVNLFSEVGWKILLAAKITRSKTATAGIVHLQIALVVFQRNNSEFSSLNWSICTVHERCSENQSKLNGKLNHNDRACWSLNGVIKGFVLIKTSQKCNHTRELHCWGINYFSGTTGPLLNKHQLLVATVTCNKICGASN